MQNFGARNTPLPFFNIRGRGFVTCRDYHLGCQRPAEGYGLGDFYGYKLGIRTPITGSYM